MDPSIPTNPAPTEPTPEVSGSPLKQIRTFQGDVADALQNKNESIVSIQRAEVEKRMASEREKKVSEEKYVEKKSIKSGIFLALGTIILLGFAGAAGYFAYIEFKTKTAPVAVEETAPNVFFKTDETVQISAGSETRERLIGFIEAERNKTNTSLFTQIELTKGEGHTVSPLSAEELLTILDTKTPGTLKRSLEKDFMLGTMGETAPKHTFLLIKFNSFEHAFPGMLAWEESLAEDLLPLFHTVTASTSPLATFGDLTLQNRDARVLKDANGETLMLYSFYDNTTLIFADNEDTLRSILTRLSAEKLVR